MREMKIMEMPFNKINLLKGIRLNLYYISLTYTVLDSNKSA